MIIGHKQQQQLLEDVLINSKHHAVMLCGSEGIGKYSTAEEISLKLLKKFTHLPEKIFQNQFHEGVYQNYIHVKPLIDEENKKKSEISIAQIRELISNLKKKSPINGYRIVIIDSIDELNINASNALLKILEEPPENVFFIIICHKISSTLATVSSRCLKINFSNLNNQHMQEILENLAININNEILKYSIGSIGFYLKIEQSGGEKILNALKNLASESNMAEIKSHAQTILKDHELDSEFCLKLLHRIYYIKTLENPNYAHATQCIERFTRKTKNSHLDQSHRLLAGILIAKDPKNFELLKI